MSSKHWVVGLGGSDHDFSAALMCVADIRVAIEQERLTRRKHGDTYWYEDPLRQSIEYCLDAEKVGIEEVHAFVSSDLLPARVQSDFRGRLRSYPHNLCHAASAYLLLPPGKRAGVLVYDGWGSVRASVPGDALRHLRETFSFFVFDDTGYQSLGYTAGLAFAERDDFPIGVTNSIGMLYELVTSLLGYDTMDGGKTMGLSSHGKPRYVPLLERFITYGGTIRDCFLCATDDRELVAALQNVLDSSKDSFETRADVAASLQSVMNKTLLHASTFFQGLAIDVLCIAGGCGLNTVANSALIEQCPIDVPIVIPPFCSDAGLGLGALWLYQFERTGALPALTFRGNSPAPALSRPGRIYSTDECRTAAQNRYPRLAEDVSVASATALAELLAHEQVIGIFNGRSEIGPRALGGRSILASARNALMRERINREIKKREPFRPLAPIVLADAFDEYFFDSRCADAYMLKVARVRARCRAEAPAVVHVDGTARVQVVSDDGDPFLIELLHAYRRLTGCAILLNTSFNRRGEPIVETPGDAVDAFLGLGLDGLYLEGIFYRCVRPTA
jgi:carbamoyltransferase